MSMRKPSRFARARVRKRERGRLPLRARVDHWMPRARLCAPSDVVAQEYTRADGWARKRAHCAKRKPRLVRSRENSTSRRATAEKSATAVAYRSEIADSQAERCCARCQMRDEDTRLFVTSSRVLVAAPLASAPASPTHQTLARDAPAFDGSSKTRTVRFSRHVHGTPRRARRHADDEDVTPEERPEKPRANARRGRHGRANTVRKILTNLVRVSRLYIKTQGSASRRRSAVCS